MAGKEWLRMKRFARSFLLSFQRKILRIFCFLIDENDFCGKGVAFVSR
jgi:hypothetical protein